MQHITADRLRGRGIPFMFVTGYDGRDIPERFAEVRCLFRPVDLEEMAVALAITVAEHGQLSAGMTSN
ncbi:response regulator [Rhizobium mongolense]